MLVYGLLCNNVLIFFSKNGFQRECGGGMMQCGCTGVNGVMQVGGVMQVVNEEAQ